MKDAFGFGMLPILPQEIMSMIVANLDKPDLLNYRLVSQSWNQECTFLLEKSDDAYMQLNAKNLQEFVTFVGQCINQIWTLPIQLDVCIGDPYPSRETKTTLDILGDQLVTLNSLLGVGAVKKLILRQTLDYYPIEFKDLTKFLTLVSVGLEYLDVSQIWFFDILDGPPNVLLPLLKKLACMGHIYPKIYEICPNLECLELNGYFGKHYPNIFQTITTLDIAWLQNLVNFLQDIKSSKCVPQIQKFRLGYSISQNSVLREILQLFGNSLKSLTLKPFNFDYNLQPQFALAFPKLPLLEDLGLEYCDQIELSEKQQKSFSLDPSQFPSLKYVDFPHAWEFASNQNEAQSPPHSKMIFPSVTSVTSRRYHFGGPFGPPHYIPNKILNMKLKPMLEYFPNATDVAVVNTRCLYYMNNSVERIETITRCNIDALEILDCNVSDVEALLKQLLEHERPYPSVVLGKFPRSSTAQNEIKSLIDVFMKTQEQN